MVEFYTSELFLPLHFVEHVIRSLKEVRHFGTLVVEFCRVEDPHLGVGGQVFASLWYGKHDLL